MCVSRRYRSPSQVVTQAPLRGTGGGKAGATSAPSGRVAVVRAVRWIMHTHVAIQPALAVPLQPRTKQQPAIVSGGDRVPVATEPPELHVLTYMVSAIVSQAAVLDSQTPGCCRPH